MSCGMKVPGWRRLRDVFLFCGGMLVVFNEVVIAESPRRDALLIAAAMLGLPWVLKKDEK